MKRDLSSVSYVFFIALFTLTFFSIVARAQSFNYSEQLKSSVLSYAFAANYKISTATRPRIYRNISSAGQTAINPSAAFSAPNSSNSGNVSLMEHRVFDLVNQKRMRYGLQPVIWSDEIAGVARLHSGNMAKYHFFSHEGVDGKRVNNRAESLGLTKWRTLGENIASSRGFGSPLESAVESWMNSPGHRENILGSQWQKTGVGIAMLPNGTYYFTQVFLKN